MKEYLTFILVVLFGVGMLASFAKSTSEARKGIKTYIESRSN